MLEQRLRQLAIGRRALVLAPGHHRRARRAGLGEAHRARDRRGEHRQVVAVGDVEQHVAGVGGAGVVQRRQCAQQPQIRVGDLLDIGDRAQELADAAVRQRLALQRHDDLVGGGQPVEGEHAQRRRAVDDDHVELVGELGQRALERILAAGPHQQHRLGAGQVDVGRQQRHSLRRGDQRGVRLDLTEQHFVHRHR